MKKIILTQVAATVAFLMAGASASAQEKFPVIPLSAGMYVIQAEVAATEAQRELGLMHREKMAPNAGMVFLFGQPAQVCMWMKNTRLPLSVAFIDAAGKIINIEDMQPETTNSHCAQRPAMYALEMNKGWFQQKHIKSGTVVSGLPKPR
jgi:uncharacterized membrane protein (UPF0127 family)